MIGAGAEAGGPVEKEQNSWKYERLAGYAHNQEGRLGNLQ